MGTRTLQGKTALITGASRGLGKAISLALAEAGARLVLTARDQALLEQTAETARSLGAETLVHCTDVTRESEIAELKQTVIGKFGTIQILVNNAGMNIRKPATDFSLAEWRQVLD